MAASVVIRPRLDGTIRSPVWTSRNAPVPYVHFAWPAARQPWPTSEACWSPATPSDRQAVGKEVESRGHAEIAGTRADFRQYSGGTPKKLAEVIEPSAACAGP